MVQEYGYEYDAALDEDLWNKTKGICTASRLWGANCLRSGRDALKAIAREYSPRITLIPALACDSMVRPFEQYGHTVKYYKLNSDYSIDMDSLQVGSEPLLFLYMDYFGRPAVKDADLEIIRAYKDIVFIEDRTHNLIHEKTSTFQPDFTIASLRKWLPVPDGGLLWGSITEPLASDTSFSAQRLKAQCMRHNYLRCGDEKIKLEYRKIFSSVSDIMDNDDPSAMSTYSYIQASGTDWKSVQQIRTRNAKSLIAKLKESSAISFIQDMAGKSDLYVAFTVPNRDEVQRRLSALGIFNTVIWPLNLIQKAICGVAKFTEENMLAAPCDQRYTVEDMEHIGSEIVRVVADVNR